MTYYAALVSLVQLIEEIIHGDQYRKFHLDRNQIDSVYGKFILLQTLLGDYSPKDEEKADGLERRIRNAAYQAQNIIEYQISSQVNHGIKSSFWSLISTPRQLEDLERVKEEVGSIVEGLMRIKERRTTNEDLQLNSYISADPGASKQGRTGGNTMVGFDEHVTKIKGQLCGQSSKLEVVSIAGMGGIGKTTLARHIFDDGLVVYHFYCRAWVTISQDYQLRKVLLDIGNSMRIISAELSGEGEEVLVEHIYKYLKGRRYLVIMDDVWDSKVWDDIKRIFPDDSNGSRVMLTTRLSDVAVYADNFDFIHQLR